jgi:hypothetical protein
MSTVKEIIAATECLSAQDRWEVYRRLGETEDVRRFKLEELRQEIKIGTDQAKRGDVSPLDVDAIKAKVAMRLRSDNKN